MSRDKEALGDGFLGFPRSRGDEPAAKILNMLKP